MKPIDQVIKFTQTREDDRREWAGTSKQLDTVIAARAARTVTGSIYEPRKAFGKKVSR